VEKLQHDLAGTRRTVVAGSKVRRKKKLTREGKAIIEGESPSNGSGVASEKNIQNSELHECKAEKLVAKTRGKKTDATARCSEKKKRLAGDPGVLNKRVVDGKGSGF